MNITLPEILQCSNMGSNDLGKNFELSVLERQRQAMKWQHQQQLHDLQQSYNQDQTCFNELTMQLSFLPAQLQSIQGLTMGCGSSFDGFMTRSIKADRGGDGGCVDVGMQESGSSVVVDQNMGYEQSNNKNNNNSCGGYGGVVNYEISRTAGCPPLVETAIKAVSEPKGRENVVSHHKMSLRSAVGRESFKKRKAAEKNQESKGEAEEENKSKRRKGCEEEDESKITEQNSNINSNKKHKEVSGCTSTDNSKGNDVQKPDYIHVRARRGQATDSHSLAERVRREKISERMKYLQDLVPGCNKITGKAGMLDEIINYVQSLQRQVEFLSMKLAAVNPRIDFSMDDLIAKEVLAACSSSLQAMGVTPDMTNPTNFLQYNPVPQMDLVCESESVDMGLRRSISAPASVPENFIQPSCFNPIPSSLPWDADLQNLYAMEFQQGRSTSFPLHSFTGTIEASNSKREM